MSLADSKTAWETFSRLDSEVYNEEWRKSPVDRISHLDPSSIPFALNLRGSEEKKQIGSGVRTHDSMIGTADENRNSTTACSKKRCQKNTQQLAELLTKVSISQQEVDDMQRSLKDLSSSLSILQGIEAERKREHALLEHELIRTQASERQKGLSEKLVSVKSEGLELKRKVERATAIVRKLKDDHERFMPRSGGHRKLSGCTTPSIFSPAPTETATLQKISQSQKYHTGVYRRSELTDWQMAWSCCLKRGEDADGCTAPTPFLPSKPGFRDTNNKSIVSTMRMSRSDTRLQRRTVDSVPHGRQSTPNIRSRPATAGYVRTKKSLFKQSNTDANSIRNIPSPYTSSKTTFLP